MGFGITKKAVYYLPNTIYGKQLHSYSRFLKQYKLQQYTCVSKKNKFNTSWSVYVYVCICIYKF